MEPYARMLLQYVQACVAARAAGRGVRLRHPADPHHARARAAATPTARCARAAAACHDWSGGTRIGASLATLNREHGRRIGRGAFVVVLSDGWDRGEPGAARRRAGAAAPRCAHRLVWLNPLKAHPGYEPLTRGMRAALPHVDQFLPGNSLASLEELAELMDEGMAERRRACWDRWSDRDELG